VKRKSFATQAASFGAVRERGQSEEGACREKEIREFAMRFMPFWWAAERYIAALPK
jgi:hypothetical protein